jgi:tetratricopeptide (TPR) repeat protein
MAWYAQAQKDVEGTVKAYRDLIARYPLEVEAYWRLGRLLARLGSDLEDIVTVFKQGLAIDPEAKEIWNDLGLTSCRPGHYDDAFATLQRYVHLAPTEPNAYDSLRMCYNYAGRYDEALAALDQALALNPDFHFANLHVGDVYFNQGRYRAAIGQYQRFVELAPSDWDRALGYNRLVLLYWKKGDLARADAAAQQELRFNNDHGGPLLIALARGDVAAERLKESFFENSPNIRPLSGGRPGFRHFYLGYDALKSGRAPEAIEHLREVAYHYRVEFMDDCLANAYLELDRLDEAIAEYERLLRINPNYPLAQYHLGQAYERKGQREQARAAYERFLQIWKDADPDIPEVIEAKRRLANL